MLKQPGQPQFRWNICFINAIDTQLINVKSCNHQNIRLPLTLHSAILSCRPPQKKRLQNRSNIFPAPYDSTPTVYSRIYYTHSIHHHSSESNKKKSRKYFHITELVCFGAKYIIDSASETTWISYRRRLKEGAKKNREIECKNLYFTTAKKSTSHTASAETEESWKLITFHLHFSEFQITFAFKSTQKEELLGNGDWSVEDVKRKKNEYLIVQAKVRVSNHVHFLIPLENKISTKELKEYGKERNKNCWYIKCVMIHLWAIK